MSSVETILYKKKYREKKKELVDFSYYTAVFPKLGAHTRPPRSSWRGHVGERFLFFFLSLTSDIPPSAHHIYIYIKTTYIHTNYMVYSIYSVVVSRRFSHTRSHLSNKHFACALNFNIVHVLFFLPRHAHYSSRNYKGQLKCT